MLKSRVKQLWPELKIKEISGRRFAVLVTGNRTEWFEKISARLDIPWDRTPTSQSSLGWIKDDSGWCCVKPAGSQGRESSGMQNEDNFATWLNERLTD